MKASVLNLTVIDSNNKGGALISQTSFQIFFIVILLSAYVELSFLFSGTSPLKFNVLKDIEDVSCKINKMKEKDRKNPRVYYIICIFIEICLQILTGKNEP